jgi:hypothetical protein
MSAGALPTTVRGMEGAIRVVVYVVLLVGLFAGAVAYAGNTFGAFDPLDPPPIPAGPGDDNSERQAKKQKGEGRAESHAPAGWVSRADAVCAATEPELVKAGLRLAQATERQDWNALAQAWIDTGLLLDRFSGQINQLGGPAGFESTWRRLLAYLSRDARDLDRIVASVGTRDVQAYAGLLAATAGRDDAEDELFLRLGAERCTFEPAGAGRA